MDWTPVLDAALKALTAIIVLLISPGGAVLVAWIQKAAAKWKDNWYMEQAVDAVIVGINFAAKTFVDSLKATDNFLEADWNKALELCVDAAKSSMPNKVMAYVERVYGDLDAWIKANAESLLKEMQVAEEE